MISSRSESVACKLIPYGYCTQLKLPGYEGTMHEKKCEYIFLSRSKSKSKSPTRIYFLLYCIIKNARCFKC